MAFGDIIRSGNSPDSQPLGIGGNASKIWHCGAYNDKVYELSTTDFSVAKQANSPAVSPAGIGGDSSKVWHCDTGTDLIYELSTSDLSVVRSSSSPSTWPCGIGGDSAKIWHLDADAHKVYELSVSDFSVVRQATATGRSEGVQGIGGKTDVIWYCAENESYVSKLHELSTSDFSSVRSTDAPTNWSSGVGGDNETIWYTQFGTDLAYELDETEPPPQPPSAPTNLLCNGQTNPVDIIAEDFQAIYNDPNAGDIAQHYRLQVNTKSDFTGRMMWDSGKTPMADTPEGTYCPLIYYN
ncbi:unnamed protein product, partial [marine sediment metagenome]